MTKNLTWKPRRRGAIYCSPACGNRCTHAEYVRACKGGEKLARDLGPDWKPYIWENLGWYFKAVSKCGHVNVHQFAPYRYWASAMVTGTQYQAHGRTAKAATKRALAAVQDHWGALTKALTELPDLR